MMPICDAELLVKKIDEVTDRLMAEAYKAGSNRLWHEASKMGAKMTILVGQIVEAQKDDNRPHAYERCQREMTTKGGAMDKKYVFEVDFPGDVSAGMRPYDYRVIVVVDGDPGGDPGQFRDHIQRAIEEWEDGMGEVKLIDE